MQQDRYIINLRIVLIFFRGEEGWVGIRGRRRISYRNPWSIVFLAYSIILTGFFCDLNYFLMYIWGGYLPHNLISQETDNSSW